MADTMRSTRRSSMKRSSTGSPNGADHQGEMTLESLHAKVYQMKGDLDKLAATLTLEVKARKNAEKALEEMDARRQEEVGARKTLEDAMSKMLSVVQSNATTVAGIVERVAVDPDDP